MIELNGVEIKPTIFPDKTSQVWKLPETLFEGNFVKITWDFESEAEIIHLAQLKDLLDQSEMETLLQIKYLPYGRQDKYINNESTFALSTFAKILNLMNFDRITIADPHSPRALELIRRSEARYSEIDEAISETKAQLICYPDRGAREKYREIYERLPFIAGDKDRDQSTGNITGYRLIGPCEGLNVLIVDDICDGGATFVFLAKALKENGANEVNLFVSHGLFTKGIQVLKDAGINRIFTKNGEVK